MSIPLVSTVKKLPLEIGGVFYILETNGPKPNNCPVFENRLQS
jgi:hypothetical protein